jgi:hypothetical protein
MGPLFKYQLVQRHIDIYRPGSLNQLLINRLCKDNSSHLLSGFRFQFPYIRNVARQLTYSLVCTSLFQLHYYEIAPLVPAKEIDSISWSQFVLFFDDLYMLLLKRSVRYHHLFNVCFFYVDG